MSRFDLAVLPGDGIGREVIQVATRILRDVTRSLGIDLAMSELPIGGAAHSVHGSFLPPATLEACRNADAVLLGAVGDPRFDTRSPGDRPESALLGLRKALGLHTNLRPARAFSALEERSFLRADLARGADLVIVRELAGGLYYGTPRGRSTSPSGRAAVNTMAYDEVAVRRVARTAFRLARDRRRHVTSVDKANVLEVSELWRDVVTETAREFPDVRLEHRLVDAFAYEMLREPTRFDVVLTGNLFGDVLSDASAAITGSLGSLPSVSLGEEAPLYEPVHGSAPDLAGRDIANPLAAILCVAEMLRHSLGRPKEAARVETAVARALDAGLRTQDLAAPTDRVSGTQEAGEVVRHHLRSLRSEVVPDASAPA